MRISDGGKNDVERMKEHHFLTQLLCWVNVLQVISIDVDQDDLGGAVGQTGVQAGHWNHNNNNESNIKQC